MNRKEVYEAIDSERDYQDSFVKDKEYSETQPVSAELLMMKVYVDRALNAWTDNKGDEASLEIIRKVAGIATRCMENHGVKRREGF